MPPDGMLATLDAERAPMANGVESDPRYLELLEANRRLRELGHRKDDALAVCAHDLRSPLNVVLGHVRLLLRGSRGPLTPNQRQSIEAIERQVGRMVELIEDLLDLRALSMGKLELERRPENLGALCVEVCGSLQVLASTRGLALECRVPDEPLELELDAVKFREVLVNLLSNAIRLTPQPGRVALEVGRTDEEAVIEVRDTGPGIPATELAHLFESEAPVRSTRRGGAGNGLGLPIAREVVELHGGHIDVSNLPEGGARFRVHLPLRDRAAPSADTRPAVLLAEDDPDARALVADLLSESYAVATAGDGEEALRLARSQPPDVILMDLFMPRLDGFAALEDLRRDPRTADVPVILLSAQGDDLTKVRGLDLGAADYLVKPFSGRELLARVAKALQQKHQREQFQAMAQTDGLTGLPNFRAFRARLEDELRRAARYQTPLALVMLDLDELKRLNDVHGHVAGNQAIAALANVIRQELRSTDFAARYGGDEFVVILPHTEASQARRFAERLRAEVSKTGAHLGLPIHVSLGVSQLDPRQLDSEAILEAADAALYAAKRAGRDRVAIAPAQEAAPGPAAP